MEDQNPIQNPTPEVIRGSTPNNIVEPEKKELLKPKWIKILIVVITILLISLPAGIYFLGKNSAPKTQTTPQPTPQIDPKTGWKIYSNPNLNFSFDYPNYFIKITDNLPKKITEGGSVGDVLTLSANDNKYNLENNLNVYLNPRFGGTCVGTYIYNAHRGGSSLTFTKIKGDNSGAPEGGKDCSTFYEAHIDLGNSNYLLMILSYDKNHPNAQADFEQIISTIKFTNPTSQTVVTPTPDPTTSWKTYTGSTFSIKYPKDYQLNINKIVATEGIIEPQENTIQLISPVLPNTTGNLSIILAFKPTKLYLEQAVDGSSTCAELSSKKLEKVQIGNYTFSQSGLINCGPNAVAFFYIENNGNIYEAKVETTADYYKDALPIIKQILNTMKFAQ